MAIRILVTGGAGQVGIELTRARWPAGTEIVCPMRDVLDIADESSVRAFFKAQKIDGIVNCAAYTAVDKAETDIANAWRANAIGPALLGAASARFGIPIVQVSTDYVFDGSASGFYAETATSVPLGVYGASKYAGEIAIRMSNPRSIVLRTAWVVSAHRNNFVKTMLRIGALNPELRVVADQYGCPTGARDIADALVTIITRLVSDPAAPTGIYHFVNHGDASWYDLAIGIFGSGRGLGGPNPVVHPIPTEDYPTPARRPANSRLATKKIEQDYGIVPRPWTIAIAEIVTELLQDHGPAANNDKKAN